MTFNENLESILKQNKNFCDNNGEILKQKVKAYAMEFDEGLIGILLNDIDTKKHFFKKVSDVVIFDYRKLIDFIDDKNFLLDSYTKFSNKVGLSISNKHIKQIDDVVLTFPFKDCVLEGGQTKEDEKKKEIFFNETLAKDEINRLFDKKIITNAIKYYYENNKVKKTNKFTFTRDKNKNKKRGLSEDTITDNLIIKGNNLLVLHTLKSNFASKVKLIYIDPPYNTGNDGFKYNDSFNHSAWLTFMKNRLEIARELLSDDGVIFVSIDDNESAYLKILMDEIFGIDSFETVISNVVKPEGRNYGNIAKAVDNIYVYFKNRRESLAFNKIKSNIDFKYKDQYGGFNPKELRNGNSAFHIENRKNLYYPMFILNEKDKTGFYKISFDETGDILYKCYPPKFKNGIQGVWRWGKDKAKNEINDLFGKKVGDNYTIFQKRRDNSSMVKNYFNEKEFYTSRGTLEIKELGYGDLFSNPKPEALIQRIIEISTQKNDLVLDFFGGSGTTGAVSHKLERQYLLIEQMDYIQKMTEARLQAVIQGEQGGISKSVNWQGGGEFIYFELDKYNQKFIDDLSIATKENIINIYDDICKKGFLNYDIELTKISKNIEEFKALELEQQKEFLVSILNKNQLYKNLSEIEDETLNISEDTKMLNKDFYYG